MEFINKLSKTVVIVFFGIFAFFYALANILFTVHLDQTVSFDKGITFASIVSFFVFLFIIYYLIKKDFFQIKEEYLLYVFLIISFIVGMTWIFINDIELRDLDDAYNCYRAACNIARGNLEPLSYKSYISVYPNNIGLITYLLIHIKLFGEFGSLYSIRIVNLMFVLLGYFALYRISKIIFNNRTVNCTLIVLMFGSMQFVFFSFFVYGNCLSYSMSLLSVMFLLSYFEDNKISGLILSSLFIIGSISIKQNSLIILIAESILLIMHFINTKKVIVIIVIIFTMFGVYTGTSGLEKYWGNKVDIDYGDTKLPTICWLGYGLNYDERRPGGYSSQFEQYHAENGFVSEFTKEYVETFIDGVLDTFKENPKLAIRFYGQKFLSSWANPQYETFNQHRELHNSDFVENVIDNKGLDIFWDGISSIVAIGVVYFLVKQAKNMSLYSMIGMIVVIGGFLFHMLWEVKAIYLYQYYMYLLPYAACGLVNILNRNKV